MTERDHLFINYATEDEALAKWLALRLTVEGYRVWISCFKLLGGEPYPKEIDTAIKDRTFRFLALLSRRSLNKPNPRKERTLALKLGEQRGEDDFVIPLNVDGLSPTELGWMTTELTFIPFNSSWAAGLKQLLKKLDLLGAPRLVPNGGAIAASKYLPDNVVLETSETLYSNVSPFVAVPERLYGFDLSRPLSPPEKDELAARWAFYLVEGPSISLTAPATFLAFEQPPAPLPPNLSLKPAGVSLWQELPKVFGLSSWQVAKPLLRKTVLLTCAGLGLRPAEDGTFLYFPSGLVPRNKLKYRGYSGRSLPVATVGERTFRGKDKFRHHLGFTFDVLRLPEGPVAAKFRIRLRLTDLDGKLLDYASALPRRKSITRTWYNYHFLSRELAILQFLAGGKESIVAGGTQRVLLQATPITLTAPRSIDEAVLPKGRQLFRYADDDEAEIADA